MPIERGQMGNPEANFKFFNINQNKLSFPANIRPPQARTALPQNHLQLKMAHNFKMKYVFLMGRGECVEKIKQCKSRISGGRGVHRKF